MQLIGSTGWFILQLYTLKFSDARTFHHRLDIDIYNEDKPGKLYDVQDRTFILGQSGTVNVSLRCGTTNEWDNRIKFNIFICTENPKTNWLYLYPQWGMCFEDKHVYHHCSIYPLKQLDASSWHFSFTAQSQKSVVTRIRTCPIYTSTLLVQDELHVFDHYLCEYTGIFLNPSSRLSLDELWNPWIYRILTFIYGLFLLKSIFEMIKYWEYRVNMSLIIYSYLLVKFLNIKVTMWYYERIVNVQDLTDAYKEYEFLLALTLSAKFGIYYVTLLLMSHGYCVYNTELMLDYRTYVSFSGSVFCFFLYILLMRDSYTEIACVVISCAIIASFLSLVWAFYFKRVAMIRYAFYQQTTDWQQHTEARRQIKKKEMLVAISFFQIIMFLVFMIVYEFFTAETYPVPGTKGAIVIESLELCLMVPLLFTFNMTDLSRYYRKPDPPPIIHVIRTPDNGYKISLSEPKDHQKSELSINESTSEFHIIRLPSRQNLDV